MLLIRYEWEGIIDIFLYLGVAGRLNKDILIESRMWKSEDPMDNDGEGLDDLPLTVFPCWTMEHWATSIYYSPVWQHAAVSLAHDS